MWRHEVGPLINPDELLRVQATSKHLTDNIEENSVNIY